MGRRERSEEFRKVIQLYILPLLHGGILEGPHDGEVMRKGLTTSNAGSKLNIAIPDTEKQYFMLKRSAPFTEEEYILVRCIVNLLHAQGVSPGNLAHLMLCDAIERAIAEQVCPAYSSAIYSILQVYNQWAAETYEGRRITHTVGIRPSKSGGDGNTFFALRDSGLLKVLGSAPETLLALGNDGSIFGMESLSARPATYQKDKETFAPADMLGVALWAGAGGKVAIHLAEDGEILIFKDKRLVFAKRRSYWRGFPHKSLLEAILTGGGIKEKGEEEAKTSLALYQTLLDLAFARSGGCIGLLEHPEDERAMGELVAPETLFMSRRTADSTAVLKALVNSRKFYEIPRTVRSNLCAVDGAVIIDRTGTIYTAGTIVKTDGNSKAGGGRSAAAMSLGKRGYGFKVSSDGYVELYHNGDSIISFA